MEETKIQQEQASTECSSSASQDSSREISAELDDIKATINPLHINNDHNTARQGASASKHSYWRGREVWDRSPELLNSRNKIVEPNRTLVDTAAPFESVKDAVNMFGGNVDWKAHRALTKEKSRNIEQELEKAKLEAPLYKKQLENAEIEKEIVLQELKITKEQVEELRLQVEKAVNEEVRAQNDSELAQLHIKQIEQGISPEDCAAAEAEIKVARTRHLDVESELQSVESELNKLMKQCDKLIEEKDIAVRKSEEALRASDEVEKLTLELVNETMALESAKASLQKVEEQRLKVSNEREEESRNWEQKLKQSQEEIESLKEQLSVVNGFKLKLHTASSLLTSLKAELATYVESEIAGEKEKSAKPGTGEALTEAKKELEKMKASIQKATDEVNCLRIAAYSLKSELKTEATGLDSLKQKEKLSAVTISALQAMLEENQAEQEEVEEKEKRYHQEMRELTHELLEKTDESEQAKSQTHHACQELTRAMEEAELAKASASAMELRLQAVLKEIEAAKASEKLSLDTIKAAEESNKDLGKAKNQSEIFQEVVSISLAEYYALSKRANEAERLANERVVAAVDQIKDAKKTESMSRERLEALYKDIKERKESLRDATEKAEKAKEGKLKAEQELKGCRAENELRWKADQTVQSARFYSKSFDDSRDINGSASIGARVNSTPIPNRHCSVDASVSELRPPRKKSLFPRILMFFARKPTQSMK